MLKELFSELELRRKDREMDFWTVACRLAAGENVATGTVEKLLAQSGKTLAELQEAVDLATQRARWHEQRQKAGTLEEEQASVQKRIAAEDRKLAAAEKAHADATAPLYARLHEIKAAISDASDARRKLIETCPDTALRDELAAVSDRLNELRAQAAVLRERGELVKQADREDEAADRLAAGLVPGVPTTRIDRMRKRAARKREAGEQALAALPAVQKEIAKLEREEAAVYERMTRP